MMKLWKVSLSHFIRRVLSHTVSRVKTGCGGDQRVRVRRRKKQSCWPSLWRALTTGTFSRRSRWQIRFYHFPFPPHNIFGFVQTFPDVQVRTLTRSQSRQRLARINSYEPIYWNNSINWYQSVTFQVSDYEFENLQVQQHNLFSASTCSFLLVQSFT